MKGRIHSYLHQTGRLGVLVELHCETDFVAQHDSLRALAQDLCLHIAAANPRYLDRPSVPLYLVEREREVIAAELGNASADEVKKRVTDGMNQFFRELCLMEQPLIKEPEITVGDLIKRKIGELGEKLVVHRFVRYAIGGE